MKHFFITVFAIAMFTSTAAFAQELSPSPEGAEVYIVSPADGATVSSPVKVVFGLKGMGVAPAGIKMDNTGHHHLLINAKKMPEMDKPLPASDTLKHFGGGQTETELELKPGKHTLQLIFADYTHTPHKKPVISKKVTIHVK